MHAKNKKVVHEAIAEYLTYGITNCDVFFDL